MASFQSTLCSFYKEKRDAEIAPNYFCQSQEPLTEEERRKLKERKRLEGEKEERERMQVLVSNFTEGQLDRYEMFRRAAFPKASIKRVMQQITGKPRMVVRASGII